MSRYSDAEIAAIQRVMEERRDVRHFLRQPVDSQAFKRILDAAHLAPSVGLMQPWRFIRITDTHLRRDIQSLVEQERLATASALGERKDEFMRLKVEGILDCGELLVAALMGGREAHIFGRRTLPEMDLASIACAIQNAWLAARAEGLGMGWVSLFDPEALGQLLRMPDDAKPVAILCIGEVDTFYPAPMLELEGWAARRPIEETVFNNRWDNAATPTKSGLEDIPAANAESTNTGKY